VEKFNMALIRNSSSFPVQLVSYQIDKTLFGIKGQGGLIYPGECRYVNAENFGWHTCMITAFTAEANYPGDVEVSGISGGIGGIPHLQSLDIGVSLNITQSDAMATMIIGKHDFVEFDEEGTNPFFKISNHLGPAHCRVNHGW
jgi:hypothetical protein